MLTGTTPVLGVDDLRPFSPAQPRPGGPWHVSSFCTAGCHL